MTEYNKDSIQCMDPIDHCRKRPGVYIGSIREEGLFHLIQEVVDNAVDEFLAGFGTKLVIKINNLHSFSHSNSISIRDYGRGIPTGYRKDINMDILTASLTRMFTGGKYNSKVYSTSSGQNGMGIKAVNALSYYFKVVVYTGKKKFIQEFNKGKKTTEIIEEKSSELSGTYIEFIPDDSILEVTEVNIDKLKFMLISLSSILPGLEICLTENDKQVLSQLESEPLRLIHEKLSPIYPSELIYNYKFNSKELNLLVSYHKTSSYSIQSFINSIRTHDHGSHVNAITNIYRESIKKITGKVFSKNQILQGMNLSISLFHPEPVYRGQAKRSVEDSLVYKKVYDCLYNSIYNSLVDNPSFVKYILELIKLQERALEDLEIKEAEKTIKSKSRDNILPEKLTVAYGASVDDRELFIVEGTSAAGNTNLARNPAIQEILPLKGKITNAFKYSYADTLRSQEVVDIFTAVGGMENSNTPLRTKNVFILADSDPDGAHISSLIISLFAILFPSFIKNHNLHIVWSPLFTAKNKEKRVYGHTVREVKSKWKKKYENISFDIYRNKGLGECDPEEMEDVISEKTRTVTKLEIDDIDLIELEKLMGDSSDLRKAILFDLDSKKKGQHDNP